MRLLWTSKLLADGNFVAIASLLAKAQTGMTALMEAVSSGHIDCVRLLLESGADLRPKTLSVRSMMLRMRRHRVYLPAKLSSAFCLTCFRLNCGRFGSAERHLCAGHCAQQAPSGHRRLVGRA